MAVQMDRWIDTRADIDTDILTGGSSPRPPGHTRPRMAMNAAQHKVIIHLKHYQVFFVIMRCNVLNVWPRAAERLDTPARTLEYT